MSVHNRDKPGTLGHVKTTPGVTDSAAEQRHSEKLQREQIEEWLEGARDPQGHPGWHPQTNGDIAALCELALSALSASVAWEQRADITERQVAWIDRDARYVAVVVNGREFMLTLPPLPIASSSEREGKDG